MLDMPNVTVAFVGEHKRLPQIEVLENALANEQDPYMRICVKSAIKRLSKDTTQRG